MNGKQDLRCSGATNIMGGEYGDVQVSGSMKSQGALHCERMHCSGSSKIDGDLSCTAEVSCSGAVKVGGSMEMGSAETSGSLMVTGDIRCGGSLRASGSVKVGGNLYADVGKFSGACACGGEVRAREISASGKLQTEQGVEAEHFRSSGKLEIRGLLNAEEIEISVGSVNEVGDIGGGKITVRKDWHGFSFGHGKPRLCTKSIEGDLIELETTEAKVVRGKSVRIGKGCVIGRVEYSESLDVDGGEVGESVKL